MAGAPPDGSAAAAAHGSTTRQQALASDPERSAWVSANAGSGKTHVLAQRVVRLLLAGCHPSSILCLTYTRAAASEMANRVLDRLADWTACDDEELLSELHELEGERPDAERLAFARRLFARALETPGGLNIQTIHAFCEALLHRFPLEANVAGHFEVLDEARAERLKEEARDVLLAEVAAGVDQALGEAFDTVFDLGGEWGVGNLLDEIVLNRQPIRRFLAAAGRGGVEAALRKALKLGANETDADVIARAWPLPSLSESDVARYHEAARGQSGRTALAVSERLLEVCAETDQRRRFETLQGIFLRKDGNERRSMNGAAPKGVVAAIPDIAERLDAGALRVLELTDRLRSLRMARGTVAALTLARRFDRDYENLKRRAGALDFTDLVTRAADLLARSGAGAWVHYKLDRSIDHILLDEAQDTSPDQWTVIDRLSGEFFAGLSSRQEPRTLFAVGDEKQSIYSFQGAEPELFMRTGHDAGKRARAAERHFSSVNLHLSFRSTADVLAAVDAVFGDADNRHGVASSDGKIVHAAHRAGEPGCVEVWEMIGKERPDDFEDWCAPFGLLPGSAPPAILARRVAATVREWLNRGETIVDKSRRRALTPGDILVLVQRRDEFVPALTRELKRRDIAVCGADRLRLVEHIAVEDLMALGRVMLLPEDDLSLCSLLKSPLFGFSEDDIYDLAAERADDESVFSRLKALAASRGGRFVEADATIAEWLKRVDRVPVFDFYARVLGRDGGRARFLARLGNEASDVLDEFLGFALDRENAGLPGLQAFVETLEARSPEIKRELDKGRAEVRVMTVHAAKGLEAPVVFLIDPASGPGNAQHLPKLRRLPVDGTAGPLPPAFLWVPDAAAETAASRAIKARMQAAAEKEYRRLLYVGMTRAADRLIVCGYHGLKEPKHRHWRKIVFAALEGHAQSVPVTWAVEGETWQGLRFRLSGEERDFPLEVGRAGDPGDDETPACLHRPLAPPERLPRPLSPASAGDAIEAEKGAGGTGRSPLFGPPSGADRPLERGHAVHRLLQLLPDVQEGDRRAAADRYLARALAGCPEQERHAIAASVIGVLENEAFAECFGPGSAAEVAVAGTLTVNGAPRAVSARLDRVALGGSRVLVVDYKTGRPPVLDADDVPMNVLVQMALYRALLRPVYPGKEVEAALVYTQAPALVPLCPERLDAALASLAPG